MQRVKRSQIVLLFILFSIPCLSAEKISKPRGFSVLGNTVPEEVETWYDQTGKILNLPANMPIFEEIPESSKKDMDKISSLMGKSSFNWVIFKTSYMNPPQFNYCPKPEELTENIIVNVSPDEYEPITFGIFGLRTGGEVTWELSEFRSKEGNMLGKELFDVRVVRGEPCVVEKDRTYKRCPSYLEHRDKFLLNKHETRQVWITVFIPEKTVAGKYEGYMNINCAGEKRKISIIVNVLPIILETPDTVYQVFLQGDTRIKGFYYKKNLQKHLIDIKEHNFNSVACDVPPKFVRDANNQIIGIDVEKVSDWVGWRPYQNLNEFMDFYKEAGLTGPIMHCLRAFIGYHNYLDNIPKDLFSEENQKLLIDFVGQFRDLAQKKGLKVCLLIGDEPANSEIETKKVKFFIPVLKKYYPNIPIVCAINGMWAGVDETQVFAANPPDVYCTNFVNEDLLTSIRKSGKELWIYNGMGKDALSARYYTGFWSWCLNAKGVSQWGYQQDCSGRGPYLSFALGVWSVTAPSPDGPLPLIRWEGAREGVDDRRYLYTLEKILAEIEHRNDIDDELRKTVNRAKTLLDILKESCPQGFQGPSKEHAISLLSPNKLDNQREAVMQMIMELNQLITGSKKKNISRKNLESSSELHINISQGNLRKPQTQTLLNTAISIPEIADSITIDGLLNENEWQVATILPEFRLIGSNKPPLEKTDVRIMMNKTHLFIGFLCYESLLDKIRVKKDRIKDGSVWEDDCVEIFLGSRCQGGEFKGVHLLGNVNGVVRDEWLDPIKYLSCGTFLWDGDWEFKTSRNSYGWTAEVSIPFSILGITPDTTSQIEMLVARERKPELENSSFPGTSERFYEPEKFCYLNLGHNIQATFQLQYNEIVCGQDLFPLTVINIGKEQFSGKLYTESNFSYPLILKPGEKKEIVIKIKPFKEKGIYKIPVKLVPRNSNKSLSMLYTVEAVAESIDIKINNTIVKQGETIFLDLSLKDKNKKNCQIVLLDENNRQLFKKTIDLKTSQQTIFLPVLQFCRPYSINCSVDNKNILVSKNEFFWPIQ